MRLARAGLIVLPILLAAALLAAWLVPPQLDWGKYRATIAQLAGNRLGLPVTIDGPVSLTLLPEPVLTAEKVSVGSPATDGVLIRVQSLRLRVALLPLLRGRVDARELVLDGPDLHIPWPAQPDMLSARPPAWLTAFAARIEDGRLSVGQFAVTGINGTLSSLNTGALSAKVSADIAGQRWHIDSRLTSAALDGSSGLTVLLRGAGRAAGTTASFSGQFSASGQLSGSVKAAGPNLSLLLPTPALRFTAEGRLTIADGLAEADELTVKLDGAPATGAVALRMLPRPRLDVALSATRLDLDPWTPLLLREPPDRQQMPIGLDFSAKAATLAGATLQHLRATFELVPGAVLVHDVAATLPGNANLRLSGRLTHGNGAGPGFEGAGRLHAPVLRTTLKWLLPHAGPEIAALPAGVAQRADLSGQVVLRHGRVVLNKLQGRFDGDAVSGSLGWKAGARPAIAANLRLDRLRLDPWMSQGAQPALQQVALHTLDTDLQLDVQHASLGGSQIDGMDLSVATLGGGLDVRQLHGSVMGAQFVVSGAIGPNGQVTDASLSLTTRHAGRLVRFLPVAWRATPALWHGPARLEVTAAGPHTAVAGSLRLVLGDLRLKMQPVVNLDTGSVTSGVTLQNPNAQRLISELGLPARLGLNGVPSWLGEGSLSLVGQVTVTPGPHLGLKHAELVAGGLRTGVNLDLDASGAQPVLTGGLDAEALPLPLPGSGPLPAALLHGWQAQVQVKADRLLAGGDTLLRKAAATLRLAQDRLSVEGLTGRLGPGTLSGGLSLDAGRKPLALSMQAKLADARISGPVLYLPIDLTTGQASGSLSLKAAGYSPTALMASLSGTVQATVQDGTLSGFDLGGLRDALRAPASTTDTPALRKALNGGTTTFTHLTLKAGIADGIVSFDTARLDGDAGSAQAQGTVVLPDATADLRIVLRPDLPNPPTVTLQLNGPLSAPHRTPQLAEVAQWRAKQVGGTGRN